MNRAVTEMDFRRPEFLHAKVEDYELRDDGKVVRKDRWEMAIRKIASKLKFKHDWEIAEVLVKVESLVDLESHRTAPDQSQRVPEPQAGASGPAAAENGSKAPESKGS